MSYKISGYDYRIKVIVLNAFSFYRGLTLKPIGAQITLKDDSHPTSLIGSDVY